MRLRRVFGAIVALGLLGGNAVAQDQSGSSEHCANQGGLLAALGFCVLPSASSDGQVLPVADGSGNLSDQFFTNPTGAMATYSRWQRANFVFQTVELNQGWYQVSYRELPSSVEEMNNQQIAGHGMNNWYALTQGPNRFNSTYTIYCMFPSEEASKIAEVQVGETREVSMKIKETRPQTLIFDCRF